MNGNHKEVKTKDWGDLKNRKRVFKETAQGVITLGEMVPDTLSGFEKAHAAKPETEAVEALRMAFLHLMAALRRLGTSPDAVRAALTDVGMDEDVVQSLFLDVESQSN